MEVFQGCCKFHCIEAFFIFVLIVIIYRRFSGANVQIEEAKGNGRRCVVSLSGAPEAVSAASFLINARYGYVCSTFKLCAFKGGRFLAFIDVQLLCHFGKLDFS